jgi:N-hydroxyarylamine O-acetyltransferase
VPFENLDVQLHRPVGLDLDYCFEKIVRQRRGG